MKPTVFSVTSVEEIGPYLQSVRQEGLAPTLAIVFSSIVHNLGELKAAFAKFDIEVFGATSSGEITNDEVHEDSISVMLLDISRDAYRLNVFDGEGKTSSEVWSAKSHCLAVLLALATQKFKWKTHLFLVHQKSSETGLWPWALIEMLLSCKELLLADGRE
jgi:hypothetical protein